MSRRGAFGFLGLGLAALVLTIIAAALDDPVPVLLAMLLAAVALGYLYWAEVGPSTAVPVTLGLAAFALAFFVGVLQTMT